MTAQGSHYINGTWVPGKGHPFASFDPSHGSILWEGHAASTSEVDAAFCSAKKALPHWSILPLAQRIAYLQAFKHTLTLHQYVLSKAISQETGKPLWDSAGEVMAMINKIDLSVQAYAVRCPGISREQSNGMSLLRHKPQGILAVFGPYNFPGHLPNGHIIPALLAGNTIIFKPSELTPHVAELLTTYWHESGLPAGVLNLLQGNKDTGILIANHADLNGLLFTGSWKTGSHLAELFAKKPEKILALEMGGNNPLVVSSIEDVKAAAYLTIQSAFISSGQRCTCARRLILIKTKQSDFFLKTLISMTQSLAIGAYDELPEPFMGPLISDSAAEQVIKQQQELFSFGGRPILALSRLARGGAFLTPGIIDMTQAAYCPDEEIFGPLLQLKHVNNLQEAILEANRTDYGLAAGLFSDSEEEYNEFYRSIKAGVINWNTQLTGASSAAPFGGIGKSGNHRPSAFYAADYCAYPVASLENAIMRIPANQTPGIAL